MENFTNPLEILDRMEDMVIPVVLDAIKNNLTLKQASEKANIPFSMVKTIMKEAESTREKITQVTIHEIKKLIDRISSEIQLDQARG